MRTIRVLSLPVLILALSLGCGKKAEPTATAPAAPISIEGEYMVVGAEMWGEKVPAEEIAKGPDAEKVFKFGKDTIDFTMSKKPETGKYTIDPSKSPAEIDLSHVTKDGKTEKSYGIYKIEGDTLTFFLAGAKDPKNRPKEFKTVGFDKANPTKEVDGGQFIVILKKK